MQREAAYEALQRRASLRWRAPRRAAASSPHPVVARVRAALLQRRARPPEERQLIAEARAFALSVPAPVRLQVCVSLDASQAYIYAWMEAAVLAACPSETSSARLAPIGDWQGASADSEAPFHYVVATDVDAEDEADFNRWYDTEHMPGLAAVPGAVHCARLASSDAGPRYHACYDLTGTEVLECAEWRSTHFKDARRIMFRTLLDERRLAVSSGYF